MINFVRGPGEADPLWPQPVYGAGMMDPYASSPSSVYGDPVRTLNAGFQPGPWDYGSTCDWQLPSLTTVARSLLDASGPARVEVSSRSKD